MNRRVQNIALFIDPMFIRISNVRVQFDSQEDIKQETAQIHRRGRGAENVDAYYQNSGKIHMYQDDITGNNAIDYAF